MTSEDIRGTTVAPLHPAKFVMRRRAWNVRCIGQRIDALEPDAAYALHRRTTAVQQRLRSPMTAP